jgi:hypothetical protein
MTQGGELGSLDPPVDEIVLGKPAVGGHHTVVDVAERP